MYGFIDFDRKILNLLYGVIEVSDFKSEVRWRMDSRLGRDFWIYRCGQIATTLGYNASSIAIVWWILGEYQKMIYVSYVIIPPLILSAISQPLIAPLGDRFNKKKLMFYGLLTQLISYMIITFLFFKNDMSIVVLIIFEIFSTAGKIVFNSGSIGILPHIIPEGKIHQGINITQRINSVMAILGGVPGGVLVTAIGVANSFFFLTICLFIASLLCTMIRCSAHTEKNRPSCVEWVNDVKEGFRYTLQNPVVCGFFLYSLIIGLAFAPMTLSFPYIIKEINELPPFYVGLLRTSMGSGLITGSLLLPYVKKIIDSKAIVYMSSVFFFLSLLLIGLYHHVIILFFGQFIIGFSRNWINVTIDSLLLINLPKDLRTRVLSNMMFFAMINMPVAMMIFGGVMDVLGVYNIFLVLSVLCFAGMLMIISNRDIRNFLSAKPEAALAMLSRKNGENKK